MHRGVRITHRPAAEPAFKCWVGHQQADSMSSDVSARESCPVCPHAGASGLLSYPIHGSEALYVGYSRDAWNGTLWLGRYDNKVSPRDKVLPMELFILR